MRINRRSISTTSKTARPGRSGFALRRDLGFWRLTFGGEQAVLKHGRGIECVAYLLYHPSAEPMHAIDLSAASAKSSTASCAVGVAAAQSVGGLVLLEKGARIQERSLGLDQAEAFRSLRQKEKELAAILEDDDASEPVKAEAQRELEAIDTYQTRHVRAATDNSQKIVRTVRMGVVRFQRRLSRATDTAGNPHPVLRPFGEHLDRYLLRPSARYCRRNAGRAGYPGCFTYEPPAGVVWEG
jgi:hypothetical protein